MKILVADDESSLRLAVRLILEKRGYEVCEAQEGLQALTQIQRERPDLAILDVTMPKLDGLEVCGAIREMGFDLPVMILSAKGATDDRIKGLRSGADDYLSKPFSEEELLLRVESLCRRAQRSSATSAPGPMPSADRTAESTPTDAIDAEVRPAEKGEALSRQVGSLSIDLRRCEVTVRGKPVSLTYREFQILMLLSENPGAVFSREEIIERLWGPDFLDGSISIPTYIRHIREKIEEDPSAPKMLQTVTRFGYRLEP